MSWLRPCCRADCVEGVGGKVVGDGSVVIAVDRIVRYEAAHIVEGEEGIVDGHGHTTGIFLEGGVVGESLEAIKTIYSKLDSRG